MEKEPVRQHYLPRMYLKNFVNGNNKIWVFNDITKETKELSIKDTTVIKHFYTIEDKNGSKDYTLEHKLSEIETICSPIIDKLINKEHITYEEKYSLSVFIALLQNRTPQAKFQLTGFINSLLEHPCLNHYETSLTKEQYWGILFNTALKYADLYAHMDWVFYYTKIEASFITTDTPVSIYPTLDTNNTYGNIGIGRKGVIKQFVIAPNLLLRIFDISDNPVILYEHQSLNNRKIMRDLNKVILRFRNQFAIAKDAGHLEYLIKSIKYNKTSINIKRVSVL